MTKQDMIRRALENGGTISHITAVAYNIPNLTAVISDLRRLGLVIKAVRTHDAAGKPYTKWMMA